MEAVSTNKSIFIYPSFAEEVPAYRTVRVGAVGQDSNIWRSLRRADFSVQPAVLPMETSSGATIAEETTQKKWGKQDDAKASGSVSQGCKR
jgi:hypothetical protein